MSKRTQSTIPSSKMGLICRKAGIEMFDYDNAKQAACAARAFVHRAPTPASVIIHYPLDCGREMLFLMRERTNEGVKVLTTIHTKVTGMRRECRVVKGIGTERTFPNGEVRRWNGVDWAVI